MSIYKRGGVYWYNFVFREEHIQRSTRQADRKVARQMEAVHRTALAKGEVGIVDRTPAPTLKDFAERFKDSVRTRSADKPSTIEFYQSKLARLLEFVPLATTRLDAIDEALLDSYIQHRRKAVSPASVNRELATLRKALRLAYTWKVIDRLPTFRMLEGERERNFVLSHAQERIYLEFAPQPLADTARLMLDTGLRVSETCELLWSDVCFRPVKGVPLGLLHIRGGKTRYAKRNVPLTARVRLMLEARQARSKSGWVFPNQDGIAPVSRFRLGDQHAALRERHRLPN